MSEPFIGEIKIISFSFPPKGWAFCNGALLPINQNQALFSVLGTTYGGDGRQTFGLPDLQGRVPMHVGNGILLGERGGETSHTLNISELTAHTHVVTAGGSATLATAGGNYGGNNTSQNFYNQNPNIPMNPGNVSVVGGSQPHENMSPYLVLNYIIALVGIFPSQN